MQPAKTEVTRLLERAGAGDTAALREALPMLHAELRAIAGRLMQGERAGHTLQATALVNEAWIRLAGVESPSWSHRGQVLAHATEVLRHLLVDHARQRAAEKRGGRMRRVPLDEVERFLEESPAELVRLDGLLENLRGRDDRKARVVELRFFGGLDIQQTAEALGISHATVEREWRAARAWLRRELERDEDGGDPE